MWCGDGIVSHFDRSIRFPSGFDAFEKVLDVRIRGNAALIFGNRRRGNVGSLPWLRVDAVAVVIQNDCTLLALYRYLPAVLVGVSITERPGGHKLWIHEDSRECIRNIGSQVNQRGSMADCRAWRFSIIGEPLNHIHEMRSLIGHVTARIVPQIAPHEKANLIERPVMFCRRLESLPV